MNVSKLSVHKQTVIQETPRVWYASVTVAHTCGNYNGILKMVLIIAKQNLKSTNRIIATQILEYIFFRHVIFSVKNGLIYWNAQIFSSLFKALQALYIIMYVCYCYVVCLFIKSVF